jgi:2-polyprenyl-3-methyl-5-hydroxy-6-metoxy-1,4-benzoquinol methylase
MKKRICCPCCKTFADLEEKSSSPLSLCKVCSHRWRTTELPNHTEYYSRQIGRNNLPVRYVERKLTSRVDTLLSLIKDGMRLLEIGCAEGELGSRIKACRQVVYQGVEPSQDSNAAGRNLDRVFNYTSDLEATGSGIFDGILSFHVLEHISDLIVEVHRWHRLLADDGWLFLEVPHRSGHPDIEEDINPEHLHQFTSASIACLLTHSGFQIDRLERGHFESPAYSDSLRVLASVVPSTMVRRERLVARFRKYLPSPFVIYGLGGDFYNYIAPILDCLPVQSLLDSNREHLGDQIKGITIESYKPERHASLPVLIASLRYEESILSTLQALGHRREKIYRLGDILDN